MERYQTALTKKYMPTPKQLRERKEKDEKTLAAKQAQELEDHLAEEAQRKLEAGEDIITPEDD